METFRKIKEHYRFLKEDEERVKSLYPIIEKRIDWIIETLEGRIREIADPNVLEKMENHPHLPEQHKRWLVSLFRDPYDKHYYNSLVKTGKRHAELGINTHYVSTAMNVVRSILMDILSEEVEDRVHRTKLKESLNKIIDINLDVITGSYVEQEIIHYSTGYRLKSNLIKIAESFSDTMNLVLVFALILITIGVVGLFVYDIIGLMEGSISKGIISALGSLLILWVLIELMHTEISHLKGGRFNISVFIGVALVAFIRDLMIVTLKHEKTSTAYYLVAAILVLGFVYWLVKKTER